MNQAKCLTDGQELIEVLSRCVYDFPDIVEACARPPIFPDLELIVVRIISTIKVKSHDSRMRHLIWLSTPQNLVKGQIRFYIYKLYEVLFLCLCLQQRTGSTCRSTEYNETSNTIFRI